MSMTYNGMYEWAYKYNNTNEYEYKYTFEYKFECGHDYEYACKGKRGGRGSPEGEVPLTGTTTSQKPKYTFK